MYLSPDKIIHFTLVKTNRILCFFLFPHWKEYGQLGHPMATFRTAVTEDTAGINSSGNFRFLGYWTQVFLIIIRFPVGLIMPHCHWQHIKLTSCFFHDILALSAPVIMKCRPHFLKDPHGQFPFAFASFSTFTIISALEIPVRI